MGNSTCLLEFSIIFFKLKQSAGFKEDLLSKWNTIFMFSLVPELENLWVIVSLEPLYREERPSFKMSNPSKFKN